MRKEEIQGERVGVERTPENTAEVVVNRRVDGEGREGGGGREKTRKKKRDKEVQLSKKGCLFFKKS